MKNKFYLICEDLASFVMLQKRGDSLYYCVKCNTLFEIGNVYCDQVYTCPNCGEISTTTKDNRYCRIFLELIEFEDDQRIIDIVEETFSYRILHDSALRWTHNDSQELKVIYESTQKRLRFSAENFSQDNDLWRIMSKQGDIDPIKFLHIMLRTVNIPAESLSYNFHECYEVICNLFYGEVLPVKELIAQLVFDKFPVFSLSKDFLNAMRISCNREIFLNQKISTMRDLCNFLKLPYKPSIIRILTKREPGNINFKDIKIYCNHIDNFDLKVDLLNYLIETFSMDNYLSTKSSSEYRSSLLDNLKFLTEDYKKELSEKHLLSFIKSMVHYEDTQDTICMYRDIKNSELYRDEKILYENRKELTAKKLHDILSEYSAIIKMGEENSPFKFGAKFEYEYEAELDGVFFVLPKRPSDLVKWSNAMNNCISSYSDKYREGTCILLGIYEKDELLYNMEIRNHKVVQFKGKYNSKEIEFRHFKAIKKYLNKRSINSQELEKLDIINVKEDDSWYQKFKKLILTDWCENS